MSELDPDNVFREECAAAREAGFRVLIIPQLHGWELMLCRDERNVSMRFLGRAMWLELAIEVRRQRRRWEETWGADVHAVRGVV